MKDKKTIIILSKEKSSTVGNIIKEIFEKDKDIITVLIGEKELSNNVYNYIEDNIIANNNYIKRFENTASKYLKGMLNKFPKLPLKEKPVSFKSKSFLHKKIKNIFIRYNPDMIICLSHNVIEPSIGVKKHLNSDCKVIALLDKYCLDERFFNKELDLFLVDNEDIKDSLVAKGFSQKKIIIANLPVKPSFKKQIQREDALKYFELDDKTTVLLIGTIYGDERLKRAINEIIEAKFDINVIVATGYNENLVKFVNELYRPQIRAVNYEIDMNMAMSLSEIIITRPTTMALTEAIYKERIIFSIFATGEDEIKTEEYLGFDLIVKLKDEKEMVKNIKKYLDDKTSFNDRLKYIQDANIGEPTDRLKEILEKVLITDENKEQTEEN